MIAMARIEGRAILSFPVAHPQTCRSGLPSIVFFGMMTMDLDSATGKLTWAESTTASPTGHIPTGHIPTGHIPGRKAQWTESELRSTPQMEWQK